MRSRRDFLKLTTAGLLIGCGSEPLAPRAPGGLAPADDGPALEAWRADGRAHPAAEPIVVEPPEAVAESALFPLGVAAGDMDGDRVTLWARYDGTAALSVVAWRMDGERYDVELPPIAASADDGGFVHAELGGLTPGARYRYCFFELEGAARVARSLVGRFKAPPAPDALVPVVLGATACTDEAEPFDTLARAAEDDLDAFLLLGDTAYCDEAHDVEAYRRVWARHTGRAEHIALRASTALYATWDDHEVANDWTPETISAARLEAARRAFFENLPLRRVEGAVDRLWRSRRIGRTVEIFVLDSRSERRPSTLLTQDEQYLSREQMDWLKQGLADSPCTFKLIMNSVPITRFPTIWNTWQVDRWDAYDAQRTEILGFIDQHPIEGVLWVSGDFHLAKMGMVAATGLGQNQLEVLVGPGAQDANALLFTLQGAPFDWASGENNYTRIELDPATRTARFVYVGRDGQVIEDRTYPL